MNAFVNQALSCLLDGTLLWACANAFFRPLPQRAYSCEKSALLLLPAFVLTFAASVSGLQIAIVSGVGLLYLFSFGLLCCRCGKGLILYCGIWGMEKDMQYVGYWPRHRSYC